MHLTRKALIRHLTKRAVIKRLTKKVLIQHRIKKALIKNLPFRNRPFQKPRIRNLLFKNRSVRTCRGKRQSEPMPTAFFLWGVHAVRAAWLNPSRRCYRLWLTEAGQDNFAGFSVEAKEQLLKRPDPKLLERPALDKLCTAEQCASGYCTGSSSALSARLACNSLAGTNRLVLFLCWIRLPIHIMSGRSCVQPKLLAQAVSL